MLRFIDDPGEAVSATAANAIVTMVVGGDYRAVWENACRASWVAYAERHGFDLLVLTCLLDGSPRGVARSPAWQKLLIFEQSWAQDYERIIWVDADIVIAPGAPDLLPCAPAADKIGISVAGAQLSPAERHIYLERLYRTAIAPQDADAVCRRHHLGQYANAGLEDREVPMLNTGVFVAAPRHHQAVMREIYAGDSASRLYEQPLFSHVLADRSLIQLLTPRFNWSVHDYMTIHFPYLVGQASGPLTGEVLHRLVSGLQGELEKAYFLHFSGSFPTLRLIANLQRDHGFRFAGALEMVRDSNG